MEAQTCEETMKSVGNACTFALVDQDWKVIDIQMLQNIIDYDQKYSTFGVENSNKSFIVGNYGGCTAGSRLLVMNFQKLKVVFDSSLEYDYIVKYIDQNNLVVFLEPDSSDSSATHLWYDAANKTIQCQSCCLKKRFITLGALNQEKQLKFQDVNQFTLDNLKFRDLKQYKYYFILICYYQKYQYKNYED
ncbi:hypothetical protein ABPG72_013199 [Tetrahymena utriculariae]